MCSLIVHCVSKIVGSRLNKIIISMESSIRGTVAEKLTSTLFYNKGVVVQNYLRFSQKKKKKTKQGTAT